MLNPIKTQLMIRLMSNNSEKWLKMHGSIRERYLSSNHFYTDKKFALYFGVNTITIALISLGFNQLAQVNQLLVFSLIFFVGLTLVLSIVSIAYQTITGGRHALNQYKHETSIVTALVWPQNGQSENLSSQNDKLIWDYNRTYKTEKVIEFIYFLALSITITLFFITAINILYTIEVSPNIVECIDS